MMHPSANSRSDPARSSPPFYEVEGVPNFRSIGGYPCSPLKLSHSSLFRFTKKQYLFRCGEPSKITQNGIETLKAFGVETFYDLRSVNEIAHGTRKGRGGVREWQGCQRVHTPVFKTSNASPGGSIGKVGKAKTTERIEDPKNPIPGDSHDNAPPPLEEALQSCFISLGDTTGDGSEGFMRAYADMLLYGSSAYRTILLHLANRPYKPLVVHCTGGKDRTGVFCALVLSICGVDDEMIAQEYNLTEIGMPEEWKEATIARLMENPALQGNKVGAANMLGAKRATMMAFLELLKEKYGGAERYAVDVCGLTADEVQRVRINMTEEVPPAHFKL